MIILPLIILSLLFPVAAADDPLPTLDELLGIAESGEQAPEDGNNDALDRALSEQEAGEAFEQAVSLMNSVAERITTENNLGITTQRMQEDIISKLEQVIESAENNSSSSSSSSSSSQSESQDQPDQQQSPQENPTEAPGEGNDNASAPSLQEGELADAPAPDGAGWGNLPERIRDALTQGLNDTYSELYRKLTEEYYRALAEDEE